LHFVVSSPILQLANQGPVSLRLPPV